MSRTVVLLAATLQAAAPAPRPVYGPQLPIPLRARGPAAPCPPADPHRPDEVVVCGGTNSAAMRLPLREERHADGEVVRHAGEPPGGTIATGRSCARPGSCEPNRLLDTIVKAVRAANGDP